MALLYILIFILWFLSALADYGQFCYVWQLKEYRLDRLRDFSSTLSGKKFFRGWRVLKRPLVYLALFIFLPVNIKLLNFALTTVFLSDLAYSARAILNRSPLLPKLTLKSAALIFISLIVDGLLFLFFLNHYLILIFLAARWLIFSALAAAMKLPTAITKQIYFKLAAKKLLKFKNLIVVGVTGSYGKTTVKNFLEQTLSLKFITVKTPKNINTELGVARFILQTDFSKVKIFIVEMAAYKIGEIKQICEIVKPTIGILTAINEQHLPLFGSIKNTQTAKYELLRSLPADGLAIVNSDNPYCREFINDLACPVKTFGQLVEFKPDCLIKNISGGAGKLEFNAWLDNEKLVDDYPVKTGIIGSHNAMNIAPVLLTANYLGLSKPEIIAACLKLKLPEATMQIMPYGQSVIINDSYNSNPEAFAAALKFLNDYKAAGKKIVISRGMIELGEAGKEAHIKIGRQLAAAADELIIISPNSAADLKAGIGESKIKLLTIFKPAELLELIKQNKNQSNVILLEGLMPEIVINEIKNANI